MVAWLSSMTWLAIVQHLVRWLWIVMMVAPLWTVAQVILRPRANYRAAVSTSRP